jgi:EAL domain-containing protein (putative c-di-GMP-specific phosphodiesterase class I)/ActR/RegA family two-component response regulator
MDMSEVGKRSATDEPAQPSELRLLVVEDSIVQRGVLVRALNELRPCVVLEADNGRSALAMLKDASVPVDIVLCDLAMPEMDGMAFIGQLASIDPAPALVIVSGQPQRVLESVEVMACAHGLKTLGSLQKPANRDRLAGLLKQFEPTCGMRPSNEVVDRITFEEIRQALVREEFYPVFQPKVDLKTGRVRGAEALVRWRRPGVGTVTPARFLPAVEQYALMDELTWTMIDQAAVACRAWNRQGLEISVAVNLSLTSLSDPGLAQRLSKRVRRHGLSPRHVVLEVTERAAMSDVASMLETLVRLFMSGFRLSIDDFGTGYSSLQQLARIPFSELKIDQSFVTGASERESLRIILGSSIQMARRLKLGVTAEGVATQQDWNLLKQLDCDFAQGYLIARPMAGESVVGWAQRWEGAL